MLAIVMSLDEKKKLHPREEALTNELANTIMQEVAQEECQMIIIKKTMRYKKIETFFFYKIYKT